MIKTKLIKEGHQNRFTYNLNKFLENNIKIIDIKFTATEKSYLALVIYEEVE